MGLLLLLVVVFLSLKPWISESHSAFVPFHASFFVERIAWRLIHYLAAHYSIHCLGFVVQAFTIIVEVAFIVDLVRLLQLLDLTFFIIIAIDRCLLILLLLVLELLVLSKVQVVQLRIWSLGTNLN